jgi:hypothetical protein
MDERDRQFIKELIWGLFLLLIEFFLAPPLIPLHLIALFIMTLCYLFKRWMRS